MRVWGLTRASDKKQVDSQQVQRELIVAKCKALGLPDPEILDEELGTSAYKTKFDQRPMARKFLREAKRGDYLIVAKIDRLGRNTADVLNTIERLKTRGVKVVICNFFGNSELETDTPMGKVVVTIFALAAELESSFRRERVKESAASRKARGIYHNGTTSFGKKLVRDADGKATRQEWDNEQLGYISEIADRISKDEPVSRIAIDFLSRGLLDHRGKPWGIMEHKPGSQKPLSEWRSYTQAALWFWRAGIAGELPEPWRSISVAMKKPRRFTESKRYAPARPKLDPNDRANWTASQWMEKFDMGDL